jgi:hypothetical protein
MRGIYAEKTADYMPNYNGLTYYTFRLGKLWGMVLDCAEDKPDTSNEYGDTVDFEPYRREETAFLEKVKESGEWKNAKYRVAICHIPFARSFPSPFDIEQDIYKEWAQLLRDHVKPQVMISGHMHLTEVWMPGGERDQLGQSCPVVVGARPMDHYFCGCGYEFGEDGIRVTFTDSTGAVVSEHHL